jgi:hypothetical protein
MYVYTSATMGAWFGEMEVCERCGWKVISDVIIYLIEYVAGTIPCANLSNYGI